MGHRRHDLAVRDPIAAQPVGDDDPRHVLQALEQFAEELLGGHRVSAWLDQDVEHIAVAAPGGYPSAPGVCWVSPIRCASQGSSCVSAAENKRQSCDPGSSM